MTPDRFKELAAVSPLLSKDRRITSVYYDSYALTGPVWGLNTGRWYDGVIVGWLIPSPDHRAGRLEASIEVRELDGRLVFDVSSSIEQPDGGRWAGIHPLPDEIDNVADALKYVETIWRMSQ